jgi:hypothetical protein
MIEKRPTRTLRSCVEPRRAAAGSSTSSGTWSVLEPSRRLIGGWTHLSELVIVVVEDGDLVRPLEDLFAPNAAAMIAALNSAAGSVRMCCCTLMEVRFAGVPRWSEIAPVVVPGVVVPKEADYAGRGAASTDRDEPAGRRSESWIVTLLGTKLSLATSHKPSRRRRPSTWRVRCRSGGQSSGTAPRPARS